MENRHPRLLKPACYKEPPMAGQWIFFRAKERNALVLRNARHALEISLEFVGTAHGVVVRMAVGVQLRPRGSASQMAAQEHIAYTVFGQFLFK